MNSAHSHRGTMGTLPIVQIRNWFANLKRCRELGEVVPSVSAIAERACLSRQTVYALLRDERPEFGVTAQIRLSRVIQQIAADPAYQQTRLMRLTLSPEGPRLRIGTRLGLPGGCLHSASQIPNL